ncbi:MAG: 5-formyltetrahydrofolate cyclo-ligase [Candidatus Dadabacteria bacterium]|nr:MAG: 5-formyltetrahydrofolate cyclo-ligase [Candidatus Dadabacteria bacterium]
MTVEEEKRRLRELLGRRVRELAPDERSRGDAAVCRVILRLEAYRRASQVLAYRALPDEVDIGEVVEHAWGAGKRVFLPVMDPGGGLTFRCWQQGEQLVRSDFGVEVPPGGEGPAAEPSIVCVPGRGFDRRGRRLGRGRGCYDRASEFLATLGPTVGVGYSCQVVDELPYQEHDRPVDLLVTERGLLWASRG